MAIERIVPGTIEWESYYANHISRYQFAKEQIEQIVATNVLDAACGVGYGSFFLAANERIHITAVDRSQEALGIASKNFTRKNIHFLEDDCHTLANASAKAPFDCIVSFETLEHLPHPELFIKNCYQNLLEGGRLIISTPNQLVSSPDGKLDWEYHEKEYTPEELITILSNSGFSSIRLYGQQMTLIGKLRDQVRAELNKINSNPFTRAGRKIQQLLKGHQFTAVLPEQAEDFEIKSFTSPEEISKEGIKGPFVLIAVCEKR